ncbi:MAG: hypothetical protein ACRCWY_09095 [Cellulosilyticaceae bacterium]
MASISKIRYTNVIYENGGKRYNDEVFTCAGHNTAILLENGGGKTVFIQAALQAVLPHTDLGERKAKETFVLDGNAAHIAIEWIISDKPRRYALTAVTLYTQNNELRSYKYAYEYGIEDKDTIETLPFTCEEGEGTRGATRVEMQAYYQRMAREHMAAKTFATTKDFHRYIEDTFKIIPEEWRSITVINGGEGSVEAFFDGCKTTQDLVEKLLLPTVEQGLVGRGAEAFAGTFESQREHFNKHKQLERSIKESEKIKAEIEAYVTGFSKYNAKVRDYEAKKEEAKAMWQLILKKEEETKEKLQGFEYDKREVDTKKKSLYKELAFVDVREAKEALKEAQANFEKEDVIYQEAKEKREDKERRRHILKLSRFQNTMNEAKAKIKLYEEELARLDEDTEVETLREDLEENSGQIKGYFVEQLQLIEQEMAHCEREKDNHQEEAKALQREKQVLEDKIQKLRGDRSKLIGKLEHQEKQMNHIKMMLVAGGAHEAIEGETKRWHSRLEAIEANTYKLTQSLRILEERQLTLNKTVEDSTKAYNHVLSESTRVAMELKQLEDAHQKLISELKAVLPVFSQLSSIYLKPQQIITAIEEQVEKLGREKEEALLLERRHAHFLENYETRDYFTVEPLLEIWVEQWMNQFSFIQTGTAFVASIEDKELRQKVYNQPKWAQLVVVADGSEETLRALLQDQVGKLTYPVGIVSLTEAQKMLTEESVEILIYPTSWREHMQAELFELHKKEAGKAVEAAMTFRKQKEKALSGMEQMLEKVTIFLERYSHEKHASIREASDRLRSQEAEFIRTIEEAKMKLQQDQKEMKLTGETLRKEAEEKNTLHSTLEKANQYLSLLSECTNEENRIASLQESIKEDEGVLSKVMYTLRNVTEALEEAKESYNALRSSQMRLTDDVLYQEVKDEKAIYTSEDITYLRDKREQLRDTLANKQKGRSEITNLLKHNQKVYEENERSFYQEAAEREEVLGELPVYREAYGDEMDRLAEELMELKRLLDTQDAKVKAHKTDFDKKEHDYHNKKETYEASYGTVGDWENETVPDKERLQKMQNELLEKEKYLTKQTSGLERELKFILDNKQQMDKKDELFGYCAPEVKVGTLDDSVEKEFMYELKVRVMVSSLLEALAGLKQEVELGKKGIEDRQLDFKLFCQREIRDSKLRNMAVQGITQKQDYEALAVWKENIVERINHTLTILERDLVDQDQQISQFIIHLYAYLRTVASELTEIPKNTRVNTEEGWKSIYEFTIPTWQEDSGKEKIRNHIYSLLDDIEGDSFLDDTGKEDPAKIKKYIKEQFKLKNLLKVVMGNENIRIRCRKVSNMSDISNQKYAWETSNKWSGGEKWSKNMALYLGILNYLAEKKQNLQNDEQKVSRAVILDNPFGKASSGHVLEPVFFIAKQLGFQIIALTAHSEGDFIRRYFPIVYSCKLRSTLDQRTSIFTKEQEIKKAYFMDNDPVALSILGSNQLSLFA